MKFDSKAKQIFKKMPVEIKNYFYEVDAKCKKHEVQLRLSGGKGLNGDGSRSGGWFDDYNKELAIAINAPLKWTLATLLHEESHLDQWLDETSRQKLLERRQAESVARVAEISQVPMVLYIG